MPEKNIPESIADLAARVKELEKQNSGLHLELSEAREQARNAEREAERIGQREDAWQAERAKIRTRARRMQLDDLEKASHRIRLEAIRSLRLMLKEARAQAKKGKPALLRLILRATR